VDLCLGIKAIVKYITSKIQKYYKTKKEEFLPPNLFIMTTYNYQLVELKIVAKVVAWLLEVVGTGTAIIADKVSPALNP
jgi:hypothetical protein